MTSAALLAKYDVAVPRYTSYPTAPQWHRTPSREQWLDSLGSALDDDGALAVYVHVPFCESLCTFCACNTVITRDHGREAQYVQTVLAELDLYLRAVPGLAGRPVRQLHLGGGTPTFLSLDSLAALIDGLRARLPVRAAPFEGSVEVDPRVTTPAQLALMRTRGLTRLSMGVQDVDPEVQHLVNRQQPVAVTAALCESARRLGYGSINFDLIYGLPGQTPASMDRLAETVIGLAPDRLAVYSFARVPWIKPAQRRFRDDQVPLGAEKRTLYERVRDPLLRAGYVEIGLDHFAAPGDALARAAADGGLHRNFMGYTDVRSSVVLGLGVSAIAETPECYHQNEKVLPVYERRVAAGELPTLRGHVLSEEDQRRRDRIAQLMTRFTVRLDPDDVDPVRRLLSDLLADGLVEIDGQILSVPAAGRPFLRNAASAFDQYLSRDAAASPTYSRSI